MKGKKSDKVFSFIRKRTIKDSWEDSSCDNCNDDLWESGKVKYAWILLKAPVDIWIQLCERCFELIP